jgi:hypothetical protein
VAYYKPQFADRIQFILFFTRRLAPLSSFYLQDLLYFFIFEIKVELHCIAMCPVHYIVADTPFRWDIPCSGAETRLYLYIYPVFPTGSWLNVFFIVLLATFFKYEERARVAQLKKKDNCIHYSVSYDFFYEYVETKLNLPRLLLFSCSYHDSYIIYSSHW